MKRNRQAYHKSLFLVSIIILFIISYLRFTFWINPNFSGEPLWIKISETKSDNDVLLELNENNQIQINDTIRAKSIVVFWFLFTFGNFFLIKSWRNSKKDMALWVITWIGLTILVIVIHGDTFHSKTRTYLFRIVRKNQKFSIISFIYRGSIYFC